MACRITWGSLFKFHAASFCDRPTTLLATYNLPGSLRLCRCILDLGAVGLFGFGLRLFPLRHRFPCFDFFARVIVANFVPGSTSNLRAAVAIGLEPVLANQRT